MKRELGIARCGLACCLCTENAACGGCGAHGCPDAGTCENLRCSLEKNIAHCYECSIFCGEGCRKGMLAKIKPYGFSLFAARYGEAALLDCLTRNERNGVVYHRSGVVGDYDGFTDAEFLVRFIKTGTYTA